jgi:hypothetical protein
LSAPSTDQLAALFVKHDAQLLSVVGRRVAAQPATVADADADAYAWIAAARSRTRRPHPAVGAARLADHHRRPRGMAPQRARVARATPLSHDDLDAIAKGDSTKPNTHELADLRDPSTSSTRLPERPRRFLLRQAIGDSYNEIAAAEHATYTTLAD